MSVSALSTLSFTAHVLLEQNAKGTRVHWNEFVQSGRLRSISYRHVLLAWQAAAVIVHILHPDLHAALMLIYLE